MPEAAPKRSERLRDRFSKFGFLSKAPSSSTASEQPSRSEPLVPPLDVDGSAVPSPDLTTRIQSQSHATTTDLWTVALERRSDEERAAIITATTLGPDLDVLERLSDELKQKRDQCEQKRLKVEFHGQQIVIRDVVDKALVWINKFKEIGDIVVQYDPVHAALPWAGVRFILQTVTAGSEQMAALLVGVEKISSIISRCRIHESMYLEKHSSDQSIKNLQSALVAAYALIQDFLLIAHRLYTKTSTGRAFHAMLNPAEITKFVDDFNARERQIEYEARICESVYAREATGETAKKIDDLKILLLSYKQPSSRLDSRVAAMFTQLEKTRQSEMLRWISPIPWQDSHFSARENRTKETGHWLLENSRFSTWQNSSSSTILWLHGSPGTGKTKLVSHVIDDLLCRLSSNPNDEALAYFYCDRNRTDYQNPTSILCSFVRQLSASRDGQLVQQSTVLLYEKKKTTGFASHQLSLEECQDQLRELTEIYPQTTLVLDAIDECDKSTRIGLVNFLNELVKRSSRLFKIFIASRPDQDLRINFGSGLNVEIKADKNKKDIEKYVEDTITNTNSPSYWQRKISKELREIVCRILVSRSEGMFQWVALQIRQLHKLSRERDIKMRLGKLPETLEEAYHEIYDRIQSTDGSAPIVAQRAFQWVMCSERPISPAMLVAAVCQDPTTDNIDVVDIDIDFVLDSCQNLLKVEIAKGDAIFNTKEDAICRFSHLSVQEYLEKNHWNSVSNNVLVAQVCLTFLTDTIQSTLSLERAEVDSEESDGSEENDESKERNGSEVSNESEDFSGSGSINEPAEPLIFTRSLEGETENQAQEQNDEFEESAESEEIDGSDDFNWSEDVQEDGMKEFSGYASTYWLIHVQRSGEVEGNFDNRLITLLKRFLGSGAETTPAYKKWYRDRDQVARGFELPSIHSRRYLYIRKVEPTSELAISIAMFGMHRMLQDSWEYVEPGQENARGDPLLLIAAYGGCASTVQSLLDKGAEIDAGSTESPSALYEASDCGEESVVKVLIENGADVNMSCGKIGNALQAASREGNESIVGSLLANGANVNAQGGHYGNALQAASSYDYKDVVRILLKHGALDPDGKALSAAASEGYESIVAMLLQASKIGLNDALVAACEGKILRFASDENIRRAVFMLLDAGAVDPLGDALIEAARGSYTSVVARLLKEHNFGVDEALISACARDTTKYHKKTQEQVRAMVILLLNAGAVDRKGEALIEAARQGYTSAVARLLDEHSVDLDEALVSTCKRNTGDFPEKTQETTTAIVILLLNAGAMDRKGEALIEAAKRGYTSVVVRLLKEHHVGLDEALVSACGRGTFRYFDKAQEDVTEIVILLLNAGAVDRKGEALIEAARQGYTSAVARLLKEYNVGIDEALVSACMWSRYPYSPKTQDENVRPTVILLLNAGAVDRKRHALRKATKHGFAEAATLLREAAKTHKVRISENVENLLEESISLRAL